MKKLLLATVVALGVTAGSLPAGAAVIEWTLNDVTFDDGGTASGTFSTDSTTGNVVAFDITTTAGTALGAAVYDSATSFIYGNNIVAANSFIIATKNDSISPYIELAFADPLTSIGTDLIETDNSWECDDCSPMRIVISGEAQSVPEPISLALLGVGVAGLRVVRRRRTSIHQGTVRPR